MRSNFDWQSPIGKSLTPDVTLPPLVDKPRYTDECTMFDALYAAFQQHAPVTLTPHPRYL
jgi:hypothetical protein